ncbi:MAG: DUF721 domain-containing protein [Muribaculaceae bacterium]|nr:DUF721 domain-containing protein [Muribaculaceae bacterium]MDE5957128.1 DUF721 domain-containing protein [Muribaculaceae bacterium]MDE7343050.1 DUF721 domain-containing protein [Muribaculaceae bacterium]
MQRKDSCSVGDVLREVLQENNMTGRLDELKAAAAWPAIVGDHIASRTLRPYVKNGAMTIRVSDAGLRHELNMNRTSLIREFNRIVGREVITSLRFTN